MINITYVGGIIKSDFDLFNSKKKSNLLFFVFTIPGGQHLGVQVGSWPAFSHFSHFGSGRCQQLADLLDTDAKVSCRQL